MKVPEIIKYKEDLEKKLNKLTDFEYIRGDYADKGFTTE